MDNLTLITAGPDQIKDFINRPNTKYFISYGTSTASLSDSESDSEEKEDLYDFDQIIEIVPRFQDVQHLDGYMKGEGLSWYNNRGFSYTFYEGNGIWLRYEGSEAAVKLFMQIHG